MATLTVWKFDTPEGASRAAEKLQGLAKEGLVNIEDAATVSWEEGASKPKTRQMHNLTGRGALGGMFWGMLFGLIFLIPLFGMAVGAAAGAIAGSLRDVGIDDDFIKRTRDEIQPGTSALFVLTTDVVVDKVRDAFAGDRPKLLHTNLSKEQEEHLHEVFV
ncbi:DUF1269 domain-containing protein [Dactylosporangium sp. NPDC050588]|uniref:DUF1269 domain-containing protein n=1 Tax=Dactylosporangium sp. NPDC050588 TaxID=3157211 RepID=UPI0033F44EFF